MRFPDRLRFAAAALALALPLAASAGAEDVRNQVIAQQKERHPSLAPSDLAAGSAAFDPERQAEAERNRPAPGAAEAIEAGKRIWTRKFGKGKSLAGCFPNGGRRIATAYPQYDPRVKRLVTLETAINQCLKTHGQPLLEAADPQTMGAVLAYVRSLAVAQKISVRAGSAAAEQRFEEGRRLYYTRMGQQNYSCASCHLGHSGNFFGNAAVPSPVGTATQWPWLREGRPVTLQMRIRECLDRMGAAPFPAGSDELAHLDYFLTYLSNGLAIRPNAWRP
ncbi:MAG: sulfur oxidation c-type cytochrome SoxA [Burkholderiales bacterium]|nr:sulfur oxidation c-type cytochrome SoxA [Burkholderiales bacterium]